MKEEVAGRLAMHAWGCVLRKEEVHMLLVCICGAPVRDGSLQRSHRVS